MKNSSFERSAEKSAGLFYSYEELQSMTIVVDGRLVIARFPPNSKILGTSQAKKLKIIDSKNNPLTNEKILVLDNYEIIKKFETTCYKHTLESDPHITPSMYNSLASMTNIKMLNRTARSFNLLNPINVLAIHVLSYERGAYLEMGPLGRYLSVIRDSSFPNQIKDFAKTKNTLDDILFLIKRRYGLISDFDIMSNINFVIKTKLENGQI